MFIKKIPGVRDFVTNTVPNTKIGEVNNKMPDTSGLVTTIYTIKIPCISCLVQKTDYGTKISDIETKDFYYF